MQVLQGISFLLLVQLVVVTGQQCSEEGVVRLADGVSAEGVGVYGRVEICINQQWGTVCDGGWDVAEARVACSQLGAFDFAIALTEYGGGSGLIHNFSCAGNENGLLNCSSDLDVDYCYHSRDVGVICYYAECNETDVRLVDGRTPNDGRVEICFEGVWGSVCNDSWDERDAEVVCRQLGYDGRPIALMSHPFLSNYSLQYHLDDVECSGSEDMLSDCAHGGIGVHNCMEMAEVAGVICSECNETDVRLVDGVTSDDGRVEICFSGLWGSVCDDSWDYRDARVVCQQLGYNGTSAALSSHRVLTDESLFYYLDDVDCRGNENFLSECEHRGVGIHNCGVGYEEAGVICSNAVDCNGTDVRLVAGTTPYDGLVEICLYGLWGSVCDTRWDYRDAEVVCRQLGYDGPSYPLLSHYGSSELRYHLDDVHCEGTESSLSDCSHRGIGVHDCYLYEAAGVVCTNVTCIEGTVHLVGGDDVSQGRVTYCYNGTWYSVCASDWDTTGEEARVVCETIGYNTSYYASVVVNYGRGTNPILPLSIQCANGTSTFSDCSTTELDVNQCAHAAGVDCFAICTTVGLTDRSQCSGESCTRYYGCRCGSDCFFYGECCPDISVTKNCFVEECEHGAVRLVGGLTDSTGRLELCALGVWGKICNAFGYWGPDNARVVCRQLGFSKDGAYTLKDDIERFGTSDKDAVIGEVHCIGTESGLLECSHSSIGFHYCSPYYLDYDEPDIVISCYDEVRGCGDGEVRLDGGFTSSTGRVEVCMDRRWGGVCSDGFDMKDARVVCSELDFNPGDGAIIEGPVTLEASPVFVGSVTCTGSEQSFSECSHNRPPSGGCSVAAISCGMSSSNQPRCTETFPTSVPDIQSYGECLVYKSETAICEGVVRLGIDHVYARSRLGDQNTIAQLLNENLKTVVTVIADHNDLCVKQVLRVLCNFYLPPCGNATHPVPPSSICQEECHMVQEKCQKTWDALYLAFRSVAPILNCNDTSSLLFPIPHCCTGAGLGISPGDQDSSQQGDSGGDVAGVVSSVIVVILLLAVAAAGAVLLLVVLPRRHKRKRMERMQLDILALPGNDAPILASVTETAMTTHNIEMEPGEKGAAMGASVVTYNPYRKTYRAGQPVSMKASDDSSSSLQVPESRNRVPTYHMRELARGKFLLNIDDITLLDCIGEGEFGIVYRGRVGLTKRDVAVKTLKGDFDQDEVDKFVEESLKMGRFKHAHVMGLIGVCLNAGSAPYIIMPYMGNGSLLKYLKKERKSIVLSDEADEDEVKEVRKRLMVMCSQIASGMEYLSADKYVHRDLAARNCMIDAHFMIKIADFGLSEDVLEKNYFRQGGGSGERVKLPVKWMAPESLSDGHFSEKSDVWSYGVTMWEIFSGGKAPYPGTDPHTLIQSLEQGYRMPQPHNTVCSEEIYGIMIECWHMAPEDRPTFKELYSSVSQSIERDAGYLQFGFNPFTEGGGEGVGGDGEEGEEEGVGKGGGGEGEGEGQEEEDGKEGQKIGSGVSIEVIPPSLDTNGAHTLFSNSHTD